jgi:LPS export ABC transporter protein LptC
LAVLALASACGPRSAPPRADRKQSIEGLTLSQSTDGRPAWTLKSPRALLREDDKMADLESPAMEFYQDGKPVSHVTSLVGEVQTDTHDVKLSSSVVLDTYEDRSRLTTDLLFYSSKRGLFHTESAVVIHRPEGVIYGEGLEAKPDLSEIRIFHQRSLLSGKTQ